MIDKKTFEILNDEKLLKEKGKIFETLKNLYDGKPTDKTVNLNGYLFYSTEFDPYAQPEKWVDASLKMMADGVGLLGNGDILRPLVLEFGMYGVHFVDKILGAEVFFSDGQWNNRYLKSAIGQLEMPDLHANETFKLAKRVADYFVVQNVKLPIFGMPTIASALNIAVNLYGDEIFPAFYEEPEAVKHDLAVINGLLLQLHEFYRDTIPYSQLQPVVAWERTQQYRCGQLCGCSTQMISKDTYDEFIKDLDDELLGVYENAGMIHLCGTHSQHIKSFAQMKNLKCLQLHNRAAQDLQAYLDGLRKDQTVYVNCCDEMPYDEAMRISGGERIVFVGEPPSAIKKGE